MVFARSFPRLIFQSCLGKACSAIFSPTTSVCDGLNFCTVSDLFDSGFEYVSKVVSLLEGWLERGDH